MAFLLVRVPEIKEDVYMEILSSSPTQYITKEIFSFNVVGTTSLDRRKKRVRWCKYDKMRKGEYLNTYPRILKEVEVIPSNFNGLIISKD